MDDIFSFLLKKIVSGGTGAVISLLIIIIFYLLWQNRIIGQNLESKNSKIDRLIDEYHNITIKLSDVLKNIKDILLDIKSKL